MKQAFAIAALFLGIIFESMLWDEQIMQSPDELTVSEFERAECGLSVVLTNAIEDQEAVVDSLTRDHDYKQKMYVDANSKGKGKAAAYIGLGVMQAAEVQFRAMRVLGLLRDMREREAGQVT